MTLWRHLTRHGPLTQETKDPDTGILTFVVNLGFNEQFPHEHLILMLALNTLKQTNWGEPSCCRKLTRVLRSLYDPNTSWRKLVFHSHVQTGIHKKLLLKRYILQEYFN